MSPLEHEHTQQQFIVQTARRLGLARAEDVRQPADLLRMVEARDSAAFRLLERFRSTYRAWFDASAALRSAAGRGDELQGLRDDLIRLIAERDARRRDLVNYLDATYPFGEYDRDKGDVVALSGIPA